MEYSFQFYNIGDILQIKRWHNNDKNFVHMYITKIIYNDDNTLSVLTNGKGCHTGLIPLSTNYIKSNITLINKIKIIQKYWRKHRILKHNKAAAIIQNQFRYCISNPYHPICKRRLNYEFIQLNEITLI